MSTTPSIPEELDLGAPWCIGEDAFAAVVQNIEELDPIDVLVEFGSGRSSVRFAQALPATTIFSIESGAPFHQATMELKSTHEGTERLEVSHRPLRWQKHGGGVYLSYGNGAFPKSVDAVLIDGPPGSTRRGREACLHQVLPWVRLGGRIYLDDYARPAEQRIVRNWLAAYPTVFDLKELRVGHHVCVLTKLREIAKGPQPAPEIIVDTVGSAAAYAVETAIARLKQPFARRRD